MNELHPTSARHRTMSRFSSSKGHGLTMSFVHSCHHRSLVASSLYEQIENLALIDDVWTGVDSANALATLRGKRAKIHRGSLQ